MSNFLIIVIGGSILFLGFCALCYYLAKLETQIEIERIKAKEKEEKNKIKNSTIFGWIFVLSTFAIIWIQEFRIQLIATLIISFIFGYLASKGEKNK